MNQFNRTWMIQYLPFRDVVSKDIFSASVFKKQMHQCSVFLQIYYQQNSVFLDNIMLRNGKHTIEAHCLPKPIKPFTLNLFNILSNGVSDQQKPEDLSNVEEKEFFQSEPEEPDEDYIEEFLGKIQRIDKEDKKEEKAKFLSKKSLRLQDQQIIEVSEEIDPGSNFEEGESVILEHIDFTSDDHDAENTPKWKPQFQCSSSYDQKETYTINCINPLAGKINDNETLSNQSPRDLEMESLKLNRNPSSQKINKNQQHKLPNKSCNDRHIEDKQDSQGYFKQQIQQQQSIKFKDHRNIMKKCNNGVHLNDEINGFSRKFTRSPTAERDQKLEISKYSSGKDLFSNYSIRDELQYNTASIVSKGQLKVQTENHYFQTQIRGYDLQAQTQNLHQQLEVMITKLNKSEDQNLKLKSKSKHYIDQINRLTQDLQYYRQQMQNLKNNNRRLIQTQNMEIDLKQSKQIKKQFNEQAQPQKQEDFNSQRQPKSLKRSLQNREYNKIQSNAYSSPIFVSNLSLKSDDLQSTSNAYFDKLKSQNHYHCLKKIQELQEYIFDIEQKISGIDIQVEKKVKSVEGMIKQQTIAKCNQKSKLIMKGMQDQIIKLQQNLRTTQQQKKDLDERYITIENILKAKDKQIISLNKEVEQKKREIELLKLQEYNPDIQISYSSPISPKSTEIQQRYSNKINENYPKKTYRPQSNYLSYIQIGSPKAASARHLDNCSSQQYLRPEDISFYRQDRKNLIRLNQNKMTSSFYKTPNCYTEARKLSPFREITSRDMRNKSRSSIKNQDFKQTHQLMSINSKIQKLRQQINKELDSIH